jgi:hypothetical protein
MLFDIKEVVNTIMSITEVKITVVITFETPRFLLFTHYPPNMPKRVMLEASHIPAIAVTERNIACLNPEDILPETVFPVTSPTIKQWKIRGGSSILPRETYGIGAPPISVMFLKN